MSPKLDDLINDNRLERLFSTEASYCILQLEILQTDLISSYKCVI